MKLGLRIPLAIILSVGIPFWIIDSGSFDQLLIPLGKSRALVIMALCVIILGGVMLLLAPSSERSDKSALWRGVSRGYLFGIIPYALSGAIWFSMGKINACVWFALPIVLICLTLGVGLSYYSRRLG